MRFGRQGSGSNAFGNFSASHFVRNMRIPIPASVKPWRRSGAITSQELKILELGALGYPDSRICHELGISPEMLITSWKRIQSKIGAPNRSHAVKRFAERMRIAKHHLLEVPEDVPSEETLDSKSEESREHENKLLLGAISDASISSVNGNQTVAQLYAKLLENLLEITQSRYGLIGEVLHESGGFYVGEHALSSSAWDDIARARFEIGAKDRLMFRSLDGLFAATAMGREVLIVNDASKDVRSGLTPLGHPPIDTFIGIPIYNGEDVVGIIGLANRPGGYAQDFGEFLRPIVTTISNITVAWQLEFRRRQIELALDESTSMLRAMIECGPAAVLYENADRRIEFTNDRFVTLFGIEVTPDQLVGLDASLVTKHASRFLTDPKAFCERASDLISGQESFYGELLEMADGRLFRRDFVVVRSASFLCGYFWHYKEVMTPIGE